MKQHAAIKNENVPLTGGARARARLLNESAAEFYARTERELNRLRHLEQRYKTAPPMFGVLLLMAAAFVGGWLVHAQLVARP